MTSRELFGIKNRLIGFLFLVVSLGVQAPHAFAFENSEKTGSIEVASLDRNVGKNRTPLPRTRKCRGSGCTVESDIGKSQNAERSIRGDGKSLSRSSGILESTDREGASELSKVEVLALVDESSRREFTLPIRLERVASPPISNVDSQIQFVTISTDDSAQSMRKNSKSAGGLNHLVFMKKTVTNADHEEEFEFQEIKIGELEEDSEDLDHNNLMTRFLFEEKSGDEIDESELVNRFAVESKDFNSRFSHLDFLSVIETTGLSGLTNSDRFFRSPKQELLLINANGESSRYQYGMSYRYIDQKMKHLKDFRNVDGVHQKLEKDQEGVEVWGHRKFGLMNFKLSVSNFWNNVDFDPKKSRIHKTQAKLGVDYGLPFLPVSLGFSHGQMVSESSLEPEGASSREGMEESYEGSVYVYGGSKFDMYLSSTYALGQDRSGLKTESTSSLWHEVSLNFRPTWSVFITPSLSFGNYERASFDYEERTESASGSLSITFNRLFDSIDLVLWTEYSETKSSGGNQDFSGLDSTVGLVWHLDPVVSRGTVSVELGYGQHIDRIYSASSYSGVSGSISFRLPLYALIGNS